MKSFNILGVNDPSWSKIIASAHIYDFYHTQSYSKLDCLNDPFLCVASIDNVFIALPIIIKSIPETELFDCTSVYGYCGPVSNLPFESISQDLIVFFQAEFIKFLKGKNLISAFSRLHPLINQERVFENFGFIREINKTVGIDLTLSKEEQLKNYRKNHRKDIEKLRKDGFSVSDAIKESEIEFFIHLYYDLMKRINTDDSYFFSREYFYHFLNNPCFEAKLLLAKYNNEIAAGALITFNKGIMQIHLCCDNIAYRRFSPLKLLFDEARLIGCSRNMKQLHLGGGVNGSSDDSLFHYKAGFSDSRFMYKTWQMIVDEDKYYYLMDKFHIDSVKAGNFFPIYRIK